MSKFIMPRPSKTEVAEAMDKAASYARAGQIKEIQSLAKELEAKGASRKTVDAILFYTEAAAFTVLNGSMPQFPWSDHG